MRRANEEGEEEKGRSVGGQGRSVGVGGGASSSRRTVRPLWGCKSKRSEGDEGQLSDRDEDEGGGLVG
jgi:hypothetical protein